MIPSTLSPLHNPRTQQNLGHSFLYLQKAGYRALVHLLSHHLVHID